MPNTKHETGIRVNSGGEARSLVRFTREERRRLRRFVERRHWRSMVATGVFTGIAIVCWWGLAMEVWLQRVGEHASASHWYSMNPVGMIASCAVLLMLLSIGPLAGLFVRDHWMKWAMAKHSGESACFDCAYPLEEIAADDERVTCPECGQVAIVVTARGMIPQRIMGGEKSCNTAHARDRAMPIATRESSDLRVIYAVTDDTRGRH